MEMFTNILICCLAELQITSKVDADLVTLEDGTVYPEPSPH
jgi:hypothetical protein